MMHPPHDAPPEMIPASTPAPLGRRTFLAASGALVLGAWGRAGLAAPLRTPAPAGDTSPGDTLRAATPDDARAHLDNVDDDIPRLLRLASVPGLSLALIGGAAPVLRSYGVRRAGTDQPVTPDTVFEAASLGKPVFAYLVLRLAEGGALDLDRPLREYLPLPDPSDARAAKITARHVLAHGAGWPEWRSERDEPLRTAFEPGSRFSYSGEGYYFLQRVVEHVTGKGVERLAEEHVFRPLGMRRSGYVWRPEMDTDLSVPHTAAGEPKESNGVRTGREFRGLVGESGRSPEDWTAEDAERALPRVEPRWPVVPVNLLPNAAWSLLTTARDYASFVGHLLGTPGAVPGGRALLERMTTPQVEINERVGWGLGLGLERLDGRQLFWHWGDNPGYKNFVVGDAAARRAVLVFTNGDGGQKVYERVVRGAMGEDLAAFLWV